MVALFGVAGHFGFSTSIVADYLFCSQAERALSGAVELDLGDPSLPGLALVEVRPNPDASNLLVVVSAGAGADLPAVERRLRRASGHLREVLARAISRKRVPVLTFVVIPEGGDDEDVE